MFKTPLASLLAPLPRHTLLAFVLGLALPSSIVLAEELVPPASPETPVGTHLLWTTEGVECIAGCDGILEPIQLSGGTNWQVAVDNFNFTPADLEIEAGDSVTWTNNGGVHNVRADDDSFRCANGCDGDGGNGDPAANAWVVTLTFAEGGVVPYYCELHGGAGGISMSGVITVIDLLIFSDGFESGNTDQWSAVIP